MIPPVTPEPSGQNRFYFQTPLPPERCEVRSREGQCPNEAKFVLHWNDKSGVVCQMCLSERVRSLAIGHDFVTVGRLKARVRETW